MVEKCQCTWMSIVSAATDLIFRDCTLLGQDDLAPRSHFEGHCREFSAPQGRLRRPKFHPGAASCTSAGSELGELEPPRALPPPLRVLTQGKHVSARCFVSVLPPQPALSHSKIGPGTKGSSARSERRGLGFIVDPTHPGAGAGGWATRAGRRLRPHARQEVVSRQGAHQ